MGRAQTPLATGKLAVNEPPNPFCGGIGELCRIGWEYGGSVKRSLLRITGAVVAGAMLMFAILAGLAYWRVSATPIWYQRLTDPEKIDVAAARAEDKLVESRNWAAATAAQEARLARGVTRPQRGAPEMAPPPEELTLRVSDEELNAFFLKWSKLQGWEENLAKYVTDPVLATHDGAIVIAGKVKGTPALEGTVVAMHFTPSLKDGQFTMALTRVTGGRLDLPVSAVEDQLKRGQDALGEALTRWRRDAKLDSRGQANSALMLTAAGRVMMSVLTHEPVEAVAFLPVDDRHSVPVRLTRVVVEKGGIELAAKAVPPADRPGVVERLKNGR